MAVWALTAVTAARPRRMGGRRCLGWGDRTMRLLLAKGGKSLRSCSAAAASGQPP